VWVWGWVWGWGYRVGVKLVSCTVFHSKKMNFLSFKQVFCSIQALSTENGYYWESDHDVITKQNKIAFFPSAVEYTFFKLYFSFKNYPNIQVTYFEDIGIKFHPLQCRAGTFFWKIKMGGKWKWKGWEIRKERCRDMTWTS
jgi:hypothetical protein